MNTLPTGPTASNAVPDPLRAKTAYDACKLHPAYRDAAVINDALVKLRDLCDLFTEKYHHDTIRTYLRRLEFRPGSLSEDFERLHEEMLGAAWILDKLSAAIFPALVPPFELDNNGESKSVKEGAL